MKKAKKLAALVLAMVMAFSLMAVAAAAYGEEEHEHTDACSEETIQPRKPAKACPYCKSGMAEVRSGTEGNQRFIDFQCQNPDCTYREIVRVYW